MFKKRRSFQQRTSMKFNDSLDVETVISHLALMGELVIVDNEITLTQTRTDCDVENDEILARAVFTVEDLRAYVNKLVVDRRHYRTQKRIAKAVIDVLQLEIQETMASSYPRQHPIFLDPTDGFYPSFGLSSDSLEPPLDSGGYWVANHYDFEDPDDPGVRHD